MRTSAAAQRPRRKQSADGSWTSRRHRRHGFSGAGKGPIMRVSIAFLLGAFLLAPPVASAQEPTPGDTASATIAADLVDQTAAPKPAFEYSDAYRTRAKIHKVASFATLPLFA